MKLIIDANIIFSALLNSKSKIASIILFNDDKITFFAPSFLNQEINKYSEKILKISKLELLQFEKLKQILFSKIVFINQDLIPKKCWETAVDLLSNIDSKDVAYIALSIFLKCKLWTGDKSLKHGLESKKLDIIITTDQLNDILNYN